MPYLYTIMLPSKFKQRYRKIIPNFEKFVSFSKKAQKVSVRINTTKISTQKFLESTKLRLKQIPWYKDGFFLRERGKEGTYAVSSTLDYFLGRLYLQDGSSMIPPLVLAPKENERVLDITAAPGSKTTQISQMMSNKGVIVANDNSITRIKALRNNINRLGCVNILITRFDVFRFPSGLFDKVLLDAPCSLEGSMRKYFINWNEHLIRRFSGMQKRMILKAFGLTKPGGLLVYSTCTYAPEENESVVQFLLNNFKDAKLEQVKIPGLQAHNGLTKFRDTSYDSCLKKCARIYSHDYNTGGFFIAKIRREER